MDRRPLSQKELEEQIRKICEEQESEDSDLDPFHDSDDSRDSDYEVDEEGTNSIYSSSEDDTEDKRVPEQIDFDESVDLESTASASVSPKFQWTREVNNFIPKMEIPPKTKPIVLANITRGSTALDCFLQIFPKSLILQISHYTNMRLKEHEKIIKKNIEATSPGEIEIILGCLLIMSYNRVPSIHMYWSRNISLGNLAIKNAISRDRFLLLISKLYFADPKKPSNSSKTYYIEDVVNCLKKTFQMARSDSTFQSIDESMTKFKGRSSLKQYLPMKPVKRGIKMWTRCDAETGYIYDTNIYSGKETESMATTLGERVVTKLSESIKNPNVVICFDRFFTSTNLLSSTKFPCVGTFIASRKNVPKFSGKLERGDSEVFTCSEGLISFRWRDTKDVLLMSNCHDSTIGIINRKGKDGSRKEVTCPEAIIFYNNFMGGVDLGDQMITLYDINRKSGKWWKKVFYRLLQSAVYNSYILYSEVTKHKLPYIEYLISLAEQIIEDGRSKAVCKRSRKQGRISKRTKYCNNVGDHLPEDRGGRNRCVRCKNNKIEKRTKIICRKCQVALCIECFTPYHT